MKEVHKYLLIFGGSILFRLDRPSDHEVFSEDELDTLVTKYLDAVTDKQIEDAKQRLYNLEVGRLYRLKGDYLIKITQKIGKDNDTVDSIALAGKNE